MKLNVLLALTDALRVKFKNMVLDYTRFFSKSQGNFLGLKATYTPREGTIDDPSKRKTVKIVTTVNEKIDYFINESKQFIDALFSQEKTNSLGIANAELIVDGISWGTFSSLELLRLKSLIEAGDLGNLEGLLSEIPVRSDSEIWKKSVDEEYTGRDVWETPMITGVSKTTNKEEYILEDPNVATGKISGYSPKTAVRTTVQELGDYTMQQFSGEWSHRERALALKRRNDLLTATIKALKECNDCESVASQLTSEKIFGYIFKG